MKTLEDYKGVVANLDEDGCYNVLWMWIKQGLINKATFITIINHINDWFR